MSNKKAAEKAQNAAAEAAATENTNGVTTIENVPAVEQEAPKAPTVGDVIGQVFKDAEEKQRELERKQQELEQCLAQLEHKKKLSEHRAKFIQTDEKLSKALEELQGDEFEHPHFKLAMKTFDQYRDREDVVSISNTDLIREFVLMLREKIADKVTEIETELVQ